jgi:hypothetical protein
VGFLWEIFRVSDLNNMIFFYSTKQHKISVSGISTLLSVVSEKIRLVSEDFCIVVFEGTV